MESSLPTWDRGVPGLLEEVGRGVSVCRQWASRHCQVLLVPLNLDKGNASVKHDTPGMFLQGQCCIVLESGKRVNKSHLHQG